jgi:hypothetical protein
MYYELEDNDSAYSEPGNIRDYPELPRKVSFNLGRRIETELATPLRFAMHPEWGRDMLLFWGSRVPLIRKDLIAAMREAGVDNIDTYDAVIYNPYTKTDVDDYQAVNIIGLVSAADLIASEYTSYGKAVNLDAVFTHIVIDDNAASGALMFRMQESVTTVVVHESVKRHLESKFPTLSFTAAVKDELVVDDDENEGGDDDDE